MRKKKNKTPKDPKNRDHKKEFYNKNSEDWDYYSGLPSPKAYEKL